MQTKMKKKYMKPIVEPYRIATSDSLMAGSTQEIVVSTDDYDEGSMTDLSNLHNSIWDDNFDD